MNTDEWKGLSAIGMVRSKRIIDGLETEEYRYFITSLTDLDKFSQAVRMHWGIENNLHWCLDMNFNEDQCRMRLVYIHKFLLFSILVGTDMNRALHSPYFSGVQGYLQYATIRF